jgi:eukaryotic-like serine/threonine-protein kinase
MGYVLFAGASSGSRLGVTSLAALQADDPQRVGPYLLLGRLGSGGMGRVYLARSPGGRQMAVKVIRPQLAEDAGFRARFAREVSAARKVGGLFTAQVVDADLDSPVPWLVTAYVPGTSLSEAVEQQGPLPVATMLALAAGLAEGLDAIHAAGVIHRDLKPSNVLLAPDGPRIIDFGISSAVDATSLTGTGIMIGSPGFMSPEQAEGMPVRPSSDIFSLAGVLIFAARGEGPFGSGDTAALLYRVVHGTPNLDQIPDKIQPLIGRCLSRDAARRPTASEFLTELTAAYPSAADLTDWLPAGILELSARRVAEIDPHPPSRVGSAAAASQAGVGLAPAVADSAVPAAAAGMGAAAAGSAAAAELAAHVGRAAAAESGAAVEPAAAAGIEAFAGPAAEVLKPAAAETARPTEVTEPTAYSGLATSGDASAQPTHTVKPPVPPATPPVPQGLQGAQAYREPQRYDRPVGSQDTRGWEAQPGREPVPPGGGPVPPGGGLVPPGGGPQVPLSMRYPTQAPDGAQPPYPGKGNEWYSPLMESAPRRRRTRWPWAVAAVAAVCAVIVAAVLLSRGSGHSAALVQPTASSPPSPTAPTPTPTVGNLQLYQLRVGDCLTGANMELNTSDPWPKLTLAVPCNQPHTAEVFLADNTFWPKNSPFPGSSEISKVGNAACNDAFRAYVGIAYSKSIYTWTNIIPDASTWPTGDRALHCVAYYSTPKQRAGATLTHSIRGSRR